jgi:hypothetical protein
VFVTADTNSDDLPVSADAFQTQPSGGDCKIFDAFDPGDCEEDGGLDMFVAELNPSGSDVLYLTYLGGSGDEVALDLAIDRGGNAYVALETDSADFPVTPGAYQATFAGGDGGGFDIAPTDNVIVKLNPTGSSLVYSTYLGGSGDECDVFFCYLSIDTQGHAFLASNTDSADFPTTAGAPQTSLAGSFDLTMSELSTDGAALVYSTYLGGSDYDATFWNAVGRNGQAYVVGTTLSTDFPTVNAVQASFGGGSEDAVVAKLNKKGTAVLFSTYLGGSDADDGISMAVDPSGDIFLTGFTLSTDFPTSAGAYQSSLDGFIDAFVTKIDLGDDQAHVSLIHGSNESGRLGGRADTTVIGRPTP